MFITNQKKYENKKPTNNIFHLIHGPFGVLLLILRLVLLIGLDVFVLDPCIVVRTQEIYPLHFLNWLCGGFGVWSHHYCRPVIVAYIEFKSFITHLIYI